MGKRPKTEKVFNFRMTAAEWARLEAAAVREEKNITDVLRDLIKTLPAAGAADEKPPSQPAPEPEMEAGAAPPEEKNKRSTAPIIEEDYRPSDFRPGKPPFEQEFDELDDVVPEMTAPSRTFFKEKKPKPALPAKPEIDYAE